MGALLDPINRTRGGIAWGLVAHTAVMFSFVTIATAMGLNLLSISRIENRDFPGVSGVLPPGPFGYKYLIYDKALSIVPNLMFQLNQWLADGLLVSIALNSAAQVPTLGIPPAPSLLHHLFHEQVGHRLPLPDVPHLFGYVLKSSANRWRSSWLTPPTQ